MQDGDAVKSLIPDTDRISTSSVAAEVAGCLLPAPVPVPVPGKTCRYKTPAESS